MFGSAWRWKKWLCCRLDDSEWWSYYKWSSHKRFINAFETLETVYYRVDWLGRDREIERDHSDEKLEETVWHAAGFHNRGITVCLARISVWVWKYFSPWHVSAVCVMFECDALIIACHFSFPSLSFTSAIFSSYLLFFLRSRWAEWCFLSFFLKAFSRFSYTAVKRIVHTKMLSFTHPHFFLQRNANQDILKVNEILNNTGP